MKKIISVILSTLLALSAFSIFAFADTEAPTPETVEKIIFDTIKAEAEANPKYEEYKDLEFEDFTFNVHYVSDLAHGIYIFDFQAKNEMYSCEVIDEQIGNYICTYCDSGHYLYAVYDANGYAQIGKLKDLYDIGTISDDIMNDFYNNHGGASIRKVGEYNDDIDKIIAALKVDGLKLFNEIYFGEAVGGVAKEIDFLKIAAQIGDDYIVIYDCDYHTLDTPWIYDNFGDYSIRYTGAGYAYYYAKEDKVISIREAFDTGIVSEEDLGNAIEKCNVDKNITIGAKIGDLSFDNTIDVLDLVFLRMEVIDYSKHYVQGLSEFNRIADLNKDNIIDIVDVVIMRNGIVNG